MKTPLLLFSAVVALACTVLVSKSAEDASDHVWSPENARLGWEKTSASLSVGKDEVPDMGNVSTLVLQSDNEDYEFFTVELGRLPVVPGKSYRAVYYVMAETEGPTDGLYLMLREHASLDGGSPLNKEYHKLSVANRSISGKDIGQWVKKEFVLTPGEGAEYLAAALVVLPFRGRITISPVQLLPEEADNTSSSDSKKKTLKRQRP